MDPREQNSIKFKDLSQEVASNNPLLSQYLLHYSIEFLTLLHRDLKAKNDPRVKQVETQLLNMVSQIETLKAQNSQSKEQARQQLGQYILHGISQTQLALEKGTNPNDLIPWFHKFLSYIEMMENLQNLDPQLAQQRTKINSTLSQIKQYQQQPEFTPGYSQRCNNPNKSSVLQPSNKNINAVNEVQKENMASKEIDVALHLSLIINPYDSDENIEDEYENSKKSLPNAILLSQKVRLFKPEEDICKLKDSRRNERDVNAGILNPKPPCTPPLYSNLNKEETKDQSENNYFFINNTNTNNTGNNIVPSNNNVRNSKVGNGSIPTSNQNQVAPQQNIDDFVQQPKTLLTRPNQLPAQQLLTSSNPREKSKIKLTAIKNIEQIILQIRNGKNEEMRSLLAETIRILDSVE